MGWTDSTEELDRWDRWYVAWRLLRNPKTRRETWPYLLDQRPVLARWEEDLLLGMRR